MDFKNWLAKATAYGLDAELLKNLKPQIIGQEDAKNLIIFLQNEKKMYDLLIIKYLRFLFNLSLGDASLLYQNFSPKEADTQTQFKISLLFSEKIEWIKIIAESAELINLLSVSPNPLNKTEILKQISKAKNRLNQQLEKLLELEFLIKTPTKQNKNVYGYKFNPAKAAEIKNILQIG